jgi:hypothetical protein
MIIFNAFLFPGDFDSLSSTIRLPYSPRLSSTTFCTSNVPFIMSRVISFNSVTHLSKYAGREVHACRTLSRHITVSSNKNKHPWWVPVPPPLQPSTPILLHPIRDPLRQSKHRRRAAAGCPGIPNGNAPASTTLTPCTPATLALESTITAPFYTSLSPPKSVSHSAPHSAQHGS